MVGSKSEFYLGMDLQDLESAGMHIEKDIWDKVILRKPEGITMHPVDYTRNRR
jgi:hypothetical protein